MKYLIPLAILSTTLAIQAKEISYQDCPAGVRSAIKAQLNGGKIDEIDRVEKNGATRYIVEIDGPARRDVTFHITPAGTIVFTSEDITLSQAPKAVRTAIQDLLKSGRKLDDIDREITSAGTRYRVDIDRKNFQDLEYLLASSGKVLQRKLDTSD